MFEENESRVLIFEQSYLPLAIFLLLIRYVIFRVRYTFRWVDRAFRG